MIYFPQLAQFPIRKLRRYRTVVNETADGSRVKARGGRPQLEWLLALTGLDNAQRDQIVNTWLACEGQAGTFTYVDPTANLLAWSGDLTQSAWTRDAGVQAQAATVVNAGQAPAGISQVIAAPAWFCYCLSFLVRGGSTAPVTVFRSAGAAVSSTTFTPGPAWTRVLLSGALDSEAEQIVFGLTLPAGTSLELAEAQVEAQPGNSIYKPATSGSAVYPNARFADAELTLVAEAAEMNSATIRITAMEP